MLVPMLNAFDSMRRRHPQLKPVVLLAPNIDVGWVKGIIGDRVRSEVVGLVKWSHDDALSEMYVARVGVLKSGTCNLEGAIAGLPFVCVYSGTLLAKVIVSTLVALREYSPVNIIRANTVKEVMQTTLSPDDVVREVERILTDGEARREMIDGLAEVRRSLCEADASSSAEWRGLTVSERVSQVAFDMVAENQTQTPGGR
jgi:lipid A disaccharide synthetase